MHTFLLIGSKKENNKKEKEIIEKNNFSKIEIELIKVEDVRYLLSLIKASMKDKIVFVSDNFENAGDEAQNALLKVLEEPPKNIHFILKAQKRGKILDTIFSRAFVYFSTEKNKLNNDEIYKKFIKMKKDEKLLFFSNIKTREDFIKFLENLLIFISVLKLSQKNIINITKESLKALKYLKENINKDLVLTNFVINLP